MPITMMGRPGLVAQQKTYETPHCRIREIDVAGGQDDPSYRGRATFLPFPHQIIELGTRTTPTPQEGADRISPMCSVLDQMLP
jgi:hypothetical protein